MATEACHYANSWHVRNAHHQLRGYVPGNNCTCAALPQTDVCVYGSFTIDNEPLYIRLVYGFLIIVLEAIRVVV